MHLDKKRTGNKAAFKLRFFEFIQNPLINVQSQHRASCTPAPRVDSVIVIDTVQYKAP